jgi:hypothetical protein
MDINDRVAFSWIELIIVILFVLLAMGLFITAESALTLGQASEEIKAMTFAATAGVPRAEAQATLTAGERVSLQQALIAERAMVDQLAVRMTITPGDATLEAQHAAGAHGIPLLEDQQATAVALANQSGLALAETHQTAADDMQWFNLRQQALVLVLAGGLTILAIATAAAAAQRRDIFHTWAINGTEVVGLTAAALLVLYGFAAFGVVGAACGSALALLLLVGWAMRWKRQE